MSHTTTLTFWCLVESDDNPFPVHISPTLFIGDLKSLIKQAKGNGLKTVDASNLGLWKVCYFYDLF